MRILQVVPSFHPSWGGPFTLVSALSKALAKKGHDIAILTSNSGYSSKQSTLEEINGIKIYYFRNYLSFKNFKIGLNFELIKFLKKSINDYDVIHLQGYRNVYNLVVQYFARKTGIPYVLQAHGTLPTLFGMSVIKGIFDRIFGHKMLRNASKVIAINEEEALQYVSRGCSKGSIEIVPNGIDFSIYEKLPSRGRFRSRIFLDEEQKVVLFLGRIHKIKGLDILVKAFANLLQEIPLSMKLVIVGPDFGYLRHIELLVESLNLRDHVIITGPFYGQEKIQAIVDSDVFVLPSRHEIFGISMIEAAACGKPVVASKISNLKGLLEENKTGLTFEVGNNRQLTESLLLLFQNESFRVRLGVAGREFVRTNFNIEKTVDSLETIYKHVIGGKAHSNKRSESKT
jgi:glycosyltransferase involved in cell wall biosynthesis